MQGCACLCISDEASVYKEGRTNGPVLFGSWVDKVDLRLLPYRLFPAKYAMLHICSILLRCGGSSAPVYVCRQGILHARRGAGLFLLLQNFSGRPDKPFVGMSVGSGVPHVFMRRHSSVMGFSPMPYISRLAPEVIRIEGHTLSCQ